MSKNHITNEHLHTFEDILDALERLAREHLLVYRVEAGRVLLDTLYGGDAQAYANKDPRKELRFTQFVTERAEALRRYGLGERTAREAIACFLTFGALPAPVRESMFYSQVRELARLHDATARAHLAVAAVNGDWTVVQLRDAVSAVKAGLPCDADPLTPGIQPQPALPPPQLSPGRLVTRAERWTADLDRWTEQWSMADGEKLRPPQRRRLLATVAAAQARLAELAAGLKGGDSESDA